MMSFLQQILTAVGLVAFVGLVFLLWFYRRNEIRERDRMRQTKADIADMTILFQTMRDIIKQQKELARDFNTKLDAKMSLVKQIMTQGIERNKELYERQQTLVLQIEEAEQQLQSLQRQLTILRDAAENQAPMMRLHAVLPSQAPPHAAVPVPAQEASPLGLRPGSPRAEELPPAASPHPQMPVAFADWADFETGTGEGSPAVEEEEEVHAPGGPEDPLAARNAFRALLNMDPQPIFRPAAPIPPLGPGSPSDAPGDNGGVPKITPLQRRVLEYRNAGMDIAQIAKELGIGKGEVQLMLSLLKQKS